VASVRKHRNRWIVEWREGGRGSKKQYRSFDSEKDAHTFAHSPFARRTDTRVGILGMVDGFKQETPPVVVYARDVFAARDLKRNTREMYANALKRIEQEPLGSMDIGDVKPRDVRAFFSKVQRNRPNIKAVLDMTFVAARREGLIRESPMAGAGIKLPKRRQKDIRAMTAAEVDRVADASGNDRDALAIRLGGFAGLRAGEVGGLRAADIDFVRCRIHVRRNAQRYLKEKGESSSIGFDSPKSVASERAIDVDCDLTEELRRYTQTHAPLPDGTIFSTSYGNPVTDQVLTYSLKRATKEAGLPRATFHDLRHAYATNLAKAGLPMPVLQRVMGWSSIRMTDVYAHIQDEALGAAAEITARLRAEGNVGE
jgi:integrase